MNKTKKSRASMNECVCYPQVSQYLALTSTRRPAAHPLTTCWATPSLKAKTKQTEATDLQMPRLIVLAPSWITSCQSLQSLLDRTVSSFLLPSREVQSECWSCSPSLYFNFFDMGV